MYLSPLKAEVVRRQVTEDGDTLTLMSDGTLKLPDDKTLDLSEIAGEALVFDNQPGNVFRVIGNVLYVAGLMREQLVCFNDKDDQNNPVHHSSLYVLCLDWTTGERLWDRSLGLGGATALAVSSDHVYVAGFREHTDDSKDKDKTCTVIAKLDQAGHLIWQLEEITDSVPHPTEVDLRPEGLVVFVDSYNNFLHVSNRFAISVDLDGKLQSIKTL